MYVQSRIYRARSESEMSLMCKKNNYRDVIYACMSRRMKNETLRDRWTHIRIFSRRYVRAIHVVFHFLFRNAFLPAYTLLACVSRSFPRCRNARFSVGSMVHHPPDKEEGTKKHINFIYFSILRRTHARFSRTYMNASTRMLAIILCKNARLARSSCRINCILPVARKLPRDTFAIENAKMKTSNTITSEG